MIVFQTKIRLLAGVLVLIGPLMPTALGAEEPQPTEQQSRIDAADTVDDLTRLAKQFLLHRDSASAGVCAVKMCRLNPELLTDSRRQSPRSWHTFWFTYRAKMREAVLTDDDAAGRVTLAEWLYEAGLGKAARDTLRRAIAIDDAMPEAITLAEKWNLYGGGPVQFDLRLGLTELLIRESFKDENQDLSPRRERAFLLVPFRYDPGETRLTIRTSDLKVTTDEGKSGSVMGIVLLERTGTSVRPTRSKPPAASPFRLKLASGNEPVWEQIQINRSQEEDGYELTCLNLASPRTRRERNQRPSRSKRTERSTRSDSRRQTRTGSGHAAFLVEVPLSMKVAKCIYRDEAEVEVDVDLTKALAEPFDELPLPEQQTNVNVLISRSAMEDVAAARVAIDKLALIRTSLSTPTDKLSEAAEQLLPHIDRALVKALSHRFPTVRKAAYSGIVESQDSLPETTFALIRSVKEPQTLLALLDEIAAMLKGSDKSRTTQESERPIQPVAQIPGAVYDALRACLQNDDARVRRQAVIVAISDSTQRGSAVLAGSRTDANELIADQLKSMTDTEQKAAIARTLVAHADTEAVAAVLDAIEDVSSLKITRDDDLFVTSLSRPLGAKAMAKLLGLLGRSDLSALKSSTLAKKLLDVHEQHANEKAVQAAIMALAFRHFDASYRSPLHFRRSGKQPPPSAFEPLLAVVAAGPPGDPSRSAAVTLIQAGRLKSLQTRLREASPATRQDLVRTLAQNKQLAELDALPMFIAGCLADDDKTVKKLALASLALMYKNAERARHWRMNMAVRQAVKMRQVVKLTTAAEPAVADHALDLIVRLTGLTDEEKLQFLKAPDAEARYTLVELGDDVESRTGTLGCLIVLDIASANGETGSEERRDRSLVSVPVKLQPAGETELCVTIGEREIGRSASGGTLKIDVAPLLLAAVRSEGERKAEWVNRMDTKPLSQPLSCQLARQPLGGYTGWVSFPPPTSDGPRLRIAGAGIVLEPMRP